MHFTQSFLVSLAVANGIMAAALPAADTTALTFVFPEGFSFRGISGAVSFTDAAQIQFLYDNIPITLDGGQIQLPEGAKPSLEERALSQCGICIADCVLDYVKKGQSVYGL